MFVRLNQMIELDEHRLAEENAERNFVGKHDQMIVTSSKTRRRSTISTLVRS